MSIEKNWKNYQFEINGLQIEAKYAKESVESLFMPLLNKLNDFYTLKKERVIVFLAAPPAVGKSTLASFLEYLSYQDKEIEKIQAIGLDGFHYHQEYLSNHTILKDGKEVLMAEVKGSPETFDVCSLRKRLQEMKYSKVKWPIYDRKLHDVVEDQIIVNRNIILIEGNWLLLNDDKWRDLKKLADYTIFIKADEKLLVDRLIERKMLGGKTREEAEGFVMRSDVKNISKTMKDSAEANLCLCMTEDGDYIKEKENETK